MSNQKKSRILYLFMGGTIAMSYKNRDDGLTPTFSAESILMGIPKIYDIAEVDVLEVSNIDSTNIKPDLWQKLAEIIHKKRDDYDGFVVSHGTDTMVFTATFLSFALPNFNKPIVFTGAQIPPDKTGSDAHINLEQAFQVACLAIPEVMIVFYSRILRANRSVKISETHPDAFDAPITGPLGILSGEPELHQDMILATQKGKGELKTKLETDIVCIQLFPGLQIENFVSLIEKKEVKGIIFEGLGGGGVPNTDEFFELIQLSRKKEIPFVITTQALKASQNMFVYEVGERTRKAGAISARDMTTETAIIKLMWLLGQGKTYDQIAKAIPENVAGEVTSSKTVKQ